MYIQELQSFPNRCRASMEATVDGVNTKEQAVFKSRHKQLPLDTFPGSGEGRQQ